MFQGKCFSQWNGYGISNNSQGKCITDNFSKETDIWDPGRAKTKAQGDVKLQPVSIKQIWRSFQHASFTYLHVNSV